MRRPSLTVVVALVLATVAVAPLSACSLRRTQEIPEPRGLAQETTQTALFYSTGRSLLEERRVVDATDTYSATLKELLAALPESNPDIAIVQPEAGFNSVTLSSDGVLTIDWKKEVLDFEAEPKEKRLAFASLLMTFGGFDEVEKLRFTVDGKDSGTIGDKDIADFWGEVSLKGQPFAVMRPPVQTPKGEILEQQLGGASEESTPSQ